MEDLQQSYPESRFVKAFSMIGSPYMVNPDFNGEKPTMFICGNDQEAKSEVTEILELFGFDVWDMGGAESAGGLNLWLCYGAFLESEKTNGIMH